MDNKLYYRNCHDARRSTLIGRKSELLRIICISAFLGFIAKPSRAVDGVASEKIDQGNLKTGDINSVEVSADTLVLTPARPMNSGEGNRMRVALQPVFIDEPLGSGLSQNPAYEGGSEDEPLEQLPAPLPDMPPSTTGLGQTGENRYQMLGAPPTDSFAELQHVPTRNSTTRLQRCCTGLGRILNPARALYLFDQGLYGATESTLLFSSRIANANLGVTDLLNDQTLTTRAGDGFGYGQRYILGLQGQVFGFEAIYWDLGSSHYESGAWKPNSIFDHFTSGQAIDLRTLDLEVTQRFCIANYRIKAAMGVRRMEYSGTASALATLAFHEGQVEVTASSIAKKSLESIGPTLALRGNKPLTTFGNSTAGIDFFWSTRISWLWSEETTSATTQATAVTTSISNPTVARSSDQAFTVSDDRNMLLHSGCQVGFQSWYKIGCRSRLTGRIGLEYQYFELADDYSMSQSSAFLTDNTTFGASTFALAENAGEDLHLIGVNFLCGINF
ncbi:MAG: hypothetical protein VYA84_12925 [Planctomycetota bacterium]|nr:hypothetical protein [Planctomycetota bacterium]